MTDKNYNIFAAKSGITATLTLNPSLDVFTDLDSELKVGDVNRVSGSYTEAGGKGINVSSELTRLSLPTSAYFPVGGENGKLLEKLVSVSGVVHRCTPVSVETRRNFKFCDRSGVTTEINERGGSLSSDEVERILCDLYADLPIISVLVISGSLPFGVDQNVYCRIIEKAKECGIVTVLDTSGIPLSLGVRSSPDLIKPNRSELSELLSTSVLTVSDAADGCREIYEKYGSSVLCTLGDVGAVYCGKEGEFKSRAFHIKRPKAATGAGDCFLAGFINSRINGGDIETAMICGAASAAKRLDRKV